jgi:hypothetical protein
MRSEPFFGRTMNGIEATFHVLGREKSLTTGYDKTGKNSQMVSALKIKEDAKGAHTKEGYLLCYLSLS